MDDFKDFELEVSSFREASQRNGSPEAEVHDAPQAENVDGVLIATQGVHAGGRGASHWRIIRGVIVCVFVVSVLALVLARSPATPVIVGDMLGIQTPTPTLALTLGMDKIYPIYSVPWGTLRVDGRVQTFVVRQGDYRPVRLSRGSHTLEYQAAPFPTLRCTISAPAAPTDNCPLITPSSLGPDPVSPDVRGLGREIDLGATPERLPAGQRAALSAAVDVTLNEDTRFHTDVATGERYATANGGIAVAAQPLTATLHVTHTPLADVGYGKGPPVTIYGDTPCADMCAEVFPFGGNLSGWSLAVAATLAWRYTGANGNMVAETPLAVFGPMNLEVAGSAASYNAHVAVQWEHQQWTAHLIDEDFGNSLCALGQFLVQIMYAGLDQTGAYSTAEAAFMAPRPADGCYLTYQRGTAGKQEPASGFLYRLGVLFAANAQAQRLFPKLPVADARDRDIIRQTGAPDQS